MQISFMLQTFREIFNDRIGLTHTKAKQAPVEFAACLVLQQPSQDTVRDRVLCLVGVKFLKYPKDPN